MKMLSKMNRAEMEVAVLESEILPCNTSEELAVVQAMDDETLRAAIGEWIEQGSEV